MTEPKDPLAFDFGVNFQSSAERVKGEKAARRALVERQLPFHVQYLDDILRSILPNDLILLGAETGAGKTEMARIIASSTSERGKNVFYFALEAESLEIERRDKYAILCELLMKRGRSVVDMNYPDWYRGKCDSIIAGLEQEAEEIIAEKRRCLHTYYRGNKFDHKDIQRLFLAINTQADLIILDHLHYVDIEDENENRGFKTTIKMIRDVALGISKPVILIAHLRKRDGKQKRIVPHIEDFHGSSDIIKIVTHSVMLAPATKMPSSSPHISNTYIYVPKDRHGGATGLVALCRFDRNRKTYEKHYTLGRPDGDEFVPLDLNEVPRWAKHHKPLTEQAPTFQVQPEDDQREWGMQ